MALPLRIFLPLAASLTFAACSNVIPANMDEAQYWQRSNTTEAIYMNGPKAQQLLNRDISRCVVELRELDNLGALRRHIPADNDINGNTPDPNTPQGEMAQWDSPEREGYMRAEHLPYHDFEGCMVAKGWDRTEYLPYDVADRSRSDYLKALTGEEYRTKTGERGFATQKKDDFDNLNQ